QVDAERSLEALLELPGQRVAVGLLDHRALADGWSCRAGCRSSPRRPRALVFVVSHDRAGNPIFGSMDYLLASLSAGSGEDVTRDRQARLALWTSACSLRVRRS